MPICPRYVDENLIIPEVFMDFLELERIAGEYIGKRLLKFYTKNGIDVREYQGQCYDGAK